MLLRHRIANAHEIGFRVTADAVMVATALLASLAVSFVIQVLVSGHATLSRSSIQDFFRNYLISVTLLLVISLSIFALNGFYTSGRSYRQRYKALIVTRAVCLSYLIFGSITFFSLNQITLPRSALVSAWLLTLGLLIGARVWSSLWFELIGVNRARASRSPDRPVRTVLVIGGAGYIGSALLPKLLAQGYKVRLLDLLLFGTEPIQPLLDHPNLEIIKADFRHLDAVVTAMLGVDAVVHLGAIVGDPACALDEQLTIDVNVIATRTIAEVARGFNVRRLVFASTCSVYGASDQLLSELSALNPVSLYARSKIASERVLLGMGGDHFAPVILRFGTIYGISGRTRFDLVVNVLTAKALFEDQIPVFGGDQWRPFVHVDDAARAILETLRAPEAVVGNQIFNVGSDTQNYTIAQVGTLIKQLVPEAQLLISTSDTDRRNYRVSFKKIQQTLGFEPHWTVEQGIQQVIDMIRSGKITNYHDVTYSNVQFLRTGGVQALLRNNQNWVDDLLRETASAPVAGG